MTGLNHVLTGSAIALMVRQPLLAAPLAFLSHFVLDATPHFGGTPVYEFGQHRLFPYIMFADGIISISAVLFICNQAPELANVILLSSLCAMIPDVLLFTYYANGRPNTWFHRFHLGIQWFERPPGLLVEASYAVFISTVIAALLWR
ncbi:MAG TPA: hypothetical protein VM581_02165 [Magnetospirillaceae bacterium]|nr:hypothetical protein [Magnetospirillaceae bacterium]